MCKTIRNKYVHYSEEYKLSVIRDYYSSGMSKYACRKKYQLISNRYLIIGWKKYWDKIYFISLPDVSQTQEKMSNLSKSSYQEETQRLKKRIKELEKALEFSRLETKARDMMIDKAEEYFDINIRKKSGAK